MAPPLQVRPQPSSRAGPRYLDCLGVPGATVEWMTTVCASPATPRISPRTSRTWLPSRAASPPDHQSDGGLASAAMTAPHPMRRPQSPRPAPASRRCTPTGRCRRGGPGRARQRHRLADVAEPDEADPWFWAKSCPGRLSARSTAMIWPVPTTTRRRAGTGKRAQHHVLGTLAHPLQGEALDQVLGGVAGCGWPRCRWDRERSR